MVQRERIIALDEIQVFRCIEYCENERTLDLFRHFCDGFQVEGVVLFEQLHRDVAVGFDVGFRQIKLTAKPFVVVQNTVVGKRKRRFTTLPEERVIVEILRFVALRCHSRVPQNRARAERQAQVQTACGLGALVD